MPPTPVAERIFRTPMLDANAAAAFLGCPRSQIFQLAESGELEWAWNVAQSGAVKRELRILARCVEKLRFAPAQSARTQLAQSLASGNVAVEEIAREIFPARSRQPGGGETIRATNFGRQMGLGHYHTLNLCDAGELKIVPGSRRGAGPTGSPDISFASVINFLKARRIT